MKDHRWILRVYRWLLRLTPELNRTHGPDMQRLLADTLRLESQGRGWRGALHVAIGSWVDILTRAVEEFLGWDRRRPNRRKGNGMNTLWQDLRYGWRGLVKSPGFAFVALVTLAVGIGANTAIFSVVNTVLLRPLSFPESERLVAIWEGMPQLGFDRVGFSPPDLRFFEEHQESFEGVGAFTVGRYELSGTGLTPQRVMARKVTSGLLPALKIEPVHGRVFQPEDDVPGHDVVMLSNDLWRRSFSADPSVVGKAVQLDRRPYMVIGILPAGFRLDIANQLYSMSEADVYIPRAFTEGELQAFGNQFNHLAIGRLKPGVTLQQAQAEAQVLADRMVKRYPARLTEYFKGAKLIVPMENLHEATVGATRTALLVLLSAVVLVLLIGCANVANLLLARGVSRQKELALRSALGAGRWRIFGQMLSESLLLGLGGGVLGIGLAFLALPILIELSPSELPRAGEISVDLPVLAFTFGVSILSAAIFALAPSWSATRQDVGAALQDASRGSSSGRGARRLQSIFAAAQVVLALVLLISAGLLLRSFAHLTDNDAGIQAQSVVAMNVPLPLNGYPEAEQIRSFYARLLEEVRGLPGVVKAGFSTDLPLKRTEMRAFRKENAERDSPAPPSVAHSWLSGDYFEAMGIPLLRGRGFTAEDRAGAPRVVLISQSMAERFWQAEDPIGQRIISGGGPEPLTIVGIVGDVNDAALTEAPLAHTYTPHIQERDEVLTFPSWDALRSLNLAVRAQGDADAMAASLRGIVQRLDPYLAVTQVQSMNEILRSSLAPQRFNVTLLGMFAFSALLLSLVGIYGVISFSVSQRTQEIGIRMALGAGRGQTLKMIFRQGLGVLLAALLIGLAAAFGATRLFSSLLVGVSATDPLTFAAVPLLLALVALLACWVPARRAARVDPIRALRRE